MLRRGLGMTAPETADVFDEWNAARSSRSWSSSPRRSAATIDPETGQPLVDVVLDKAGQKGTGRWTAQVALDLGVAIPTIAAAIDARVLSSLKEERVAAAAALKGRHRADAVPPCDRASRSIDDLARRALCRAHLRLRAGHGADPRRRRRRTSGTSTSSEIGRIWKGGCIIRARLLDPVRQAFEAQPGAGEPAARSGARRRRSTRAQAGWRRTVSRAAGAGIPHAGARDRAWPTSKLPHRAAAAEPDAGAARRVRRPHVRARSIAPAPCTASGMLAAVRRRRVPVASRQNHVSPDPEPEDPESRLRLNLEPGSRARIPTAKENMHHATSLNLASLLEHRARLTPDLAAMTFRACTRRTRS